MLATMIQLSLYTLPISEIKYDPQAHLWRLYLKNVVIEMWREGEGGFLDPDFSEE